MLTYQARLPDGQIVTHTTWRPCRYAMCLLYRSPRFIPWVARHWLAAEPHQALMRRLVALIQVEQHAVIDVCLVRATLVASSIELDPSERTDYGR